MPRSFLHFDQQGKTRTWALANGATDTLYFCDDGSLVLNGVAYGKIADVMLNGSSCVVGDGIAVLPTTLPNYYKLKLGTLKDYDGTAEVTISKSDLETLLAKGSANGVAGLDSNGRVPPQQLPSYVDDIIDIIGCYESAGELYRPLVGGKLKPNPSLSDFTNDTRISMTAQTGVYYMALDYTAASNDPGIYHYVSGTSWTREYGETGKIYIEDSTNKQYRFAENDYTPHEVIASPGTTDDIIEGTRKFVTAAQKTNWDNHIGNSNIHVTSSNKSTWDGKYTKPSGGIPETDLASAVQTKLGNGNDAYAAAVTNLRKAADGIRAIAQASDTALVSEKNLATVLKAITDRLDALEDALTLEVPES